MTYQELIDKAVLQAKIGLDPQVVTTRFELVANSLLGQVFEDAARSMSSDLDVRVSETITFTNGVGTLPSTVFTGYLDNAVLYDPTDPAKEYVYVPSWEDFPRVYDTRMGYFTVRNGTSIYVIELGESYVEGDGLTGDLTLVVAGVPVVPTTASATIDAPPEFTNKALDLLVERLRGAS